MSSLESLVLRVEKGTMDALELAALTAVLAAVSADAPPRDAAARGRAVARWRRLERARGFTSPRAWRHHPA